MASAPPHGILGSAFRMAFTDPGLFRELTIAQAIGPHATAGEHVARALFSDKMPDDAIRRYMRRFQGESLLVTLDLLGFELPSSLPILDVPVLVLVRTTGSSFRALCRRRPTPTGRRRR